MKATRSKPSVLHPRCQSPGTNKRRKERKKKNLKKKKATLDFWANFSLFIKYVASFGERLVENLFKQKQIFKGAGGFDTGPG